MRTYLDKSLKLSITISFAFMSYVFLSIFLNCESPVVVVLSGSMEPGFKRGDILLLDNRNIVRENNQENSENDLFVSHSFQGVNVGIGDIAVYNVKNRKIPIVHRIVKTYQNDDTDILLMTKGDNNRLDDRDLFQKDQRLLDRDEDVIGVVRWFIPYIGYATIVLNDFPALKYAVFAVLGALSLFKNE